VGPGPAEPGNFWLPPAPLPPRPPVLEAGSELLLRQLPVPAALLGGDNLVQRLSPAYERFGENPGREGRAP
jgi:hypothetical protein